MRCVSRALLELDPARTGYHARNVFQFPFGRNDPKVYSYYHSAQHRQKTSCSAGKNRKTCLRCSYFCAVGENGPNWLRSPPFSSYQVWLVMKWYIRLGI